MLNDERSYFVRRATEESEAAQRAECPQAAAAHREMAARYAELIGDARILAKAETGEISSRSHEPSA